MSLARRRKRAVETNLEGANLRKRGIAEASAEVSLPFLEPKAYRPRPSGFDFSPCRGCPSRADPGKILVGRGQLVALLAIWAS